MRVHRWYLNGVILLGSVLVLILPIAVNNAWADDNYYMLVFAHQSNERQPRFSHTFATFVKATGEGAAQEKSKLEAHTISWLPASLDIRVLRRRPEPGTNLDLKGSLEFARSQGTTVFMWGPYRIKKELYDRAVQRIGQLNEGAFQYKAIDQRFRTSGVINCIHAVSDLDSDQGYLHVGTEHGAAASSLVVRHLDRWIIRSDELHDWVGEKLGVLNDSIVRRRNGTAVRESSRP